MEMDGVRDDLSLSEGAARWLSNRQPEGSEASAEPLSPVARPTKDRRGDGPRSETAIPAVCGDRHRRCGPEPESGRFIEIICPDCGGEGGNQVSWYATGRNYHPCRTCDGSGMVEIEVDGEEGESE